MVFIKLKRPYEECSICLDPMKKYKKIIVLPCKHYFHSSCLYYWLIKKIYNKYENTVFEGKCPICQKDFIQIHYAKYRRWFQKK